MNKYEVVQTLGRGSYGRVDLVRLKSSGEQFAMKKVKLSSVSDGDKMKALDEVKVLSKLKHPNIVTFIESFQENNSLFIVMEYMDGGDLAKKIEQRGSSYLSENEIMFNFVQILLALSYLHDHKILHRDIKPENCFMTKHGILKLGDFGIAKSVGQSSDLAKTVIGTPLYLAPEIWDNIPYSYAADIYSLGVVLYELCTLKRPYNTDSVTQLLKMVTQGQYEPLPSFFSKPLRQLVENMMWRDPNLRPSAKQILQYPFIQKVIKDLVVVNKQKIIEIPKMPLLNSPNKKPGGRQRLLNPSLITVKKNDVNNTTKVQNLKTMTSTVYVDKNDNKDDDNNEKEEIVFEDDFIDFIEDDFISFEEDEEEDFDNDAFHLLEDVTQALQESIMPSNTTYKSKSSPLFQPKKTDPNELEKYRIKLKKQLGEERLSQIYDTLQDLSNPDSLREIRRMEREDPYAVDDVKVLIEMEESL